VVAEQFEPAGCGDDVSGGLTKMSLKDCLCVLNIFCCH